MIQSILPQGPSTVTVEDGAFTITSTIGTASAEPGTSKEAAAASASGGASAAPFTPSPRMSPGMTVKQGLLYLFGGTVEDGDKQYTLKDFYSIGEQFVNEPSLEPCKISCLIHREWRGQMCSWAGAWTHYLSKRFYPLNHRINAWVFLPYNTSENHEENLNSKICSCVTKSREEK